MQMAKSQGAICGTARIIPFLWLYNNLLPLNVCLVLRKTPVSIYILVLYIYKQFKSGLAAPPLGEVTCYSVYILTLSFIFFSLSTNYRTERTIYNGNWKQTSFIWKFFPFCFDFLIAGNYKIIIRKCKNGKTTRIFFIFYLIN